MDGLKNRLTRQKAATEASTQATTASPSEERPVREASEKAKKNSVWFEAEHKRRPKPSGKTAPAKSKPKASNAASRKKSPARKNTSSKIPSKSTKGRSRVSADESEEETEEMTDENEPEVDEENDDSDEAAEVYFGSWDDSERVGIEDEVFVPPHSFSRASSISLPPALELEEEENDIPPNNKHKTPPTVDSDDKVETSGPKRSRADMFLSERPQIINAHASTSKTETSKAGGSDKQVQNCKIQWPDITEYTPLAPGARLLSKSKQPQHFQALLEKATVNAIALFLFDTAYPDPKKKTDMLTEALVMAAQDLKQQDILKRLQESAEYKYRKYLQDYIFNQVVHAWGEVRKAVTTLILSSYPLTRTDNEDLPVYLSFIRKKCRYIYPQMITTSLLESQSVSASNLDVQGQSVLPLNRNDEKTLKKSQPYKHIVITNALKTMFAGDTSPGMVYQDLFASTVQHSDAKEIPRVMIALVASVVHFCLGEWASGSHIPQSFKANTLRDEYNKNTGFLNKIALNPRKYHCLMADLYQIASGDVVDGDSTDNGVPEVDLTELDG
ncbi:hypothetical protein K435DRAFT_861848 [Dendrothele bispora CBS 962.96]|uniref:DUF6532 domain-containing protein n=1 Tax=Dendrothele bispora (strain CBS 962.96) TaxID=1314807 RepID=A0A4S8LU74_DENBC|nr:hypothetical protein K435DRAFT_861848 [Dendrothele bispora CBS 962.96]